MFLLSSFPPPTERLQHVQKSTQAFLNERSCGTGTLYIAEEKLSWIDDQTKDGFSIEYPSISLHAVCRDTSQFPHECLYCMTEFPLEEAPESNEDEDDASQIGELRFVPDDKTSLHAMYESLCACQILHPDPEDLDDNEIAGYGYEDSDDVELNEEGQANLERLERAFQMPSQEEFLEMTTANNGQTNGHGEDMEEEEGQFEDAGGDS